MALIGLRGLPQHTDSFIEIWNKLDEPLPPQWIVKDYFDDMKRIVEILYEIPTTTKLFDPIITPKKNDVVEMRYLDLLYETQRNFFNNFCVEEKFIENFLEEYTPMSSHFESGNYSNTCNKCGENFMWCHKNQTRCQKCCSRGEYPNWIIKNPSITLTKEIQKMGGEIITIVEKEFRIPNEEDWLSKTKKRDFGAGIQDHCYIYINGKYALSDNLYERVKDFRSDNGDFNSLEYLMNR